MTQGENQTTAARGAEIEILSTPAELDLATADGLVEQGYAAIARLARLLLLDLTGLSFCDACGLSAFVRIANHADASGCRFGLIAPRPPVAKILRITGLNGRLPVFANIDDALALLMPQDGAADTERGDRAHVLRGRRGTKITLTSSAIGPTSSAGPASPTAPAQPPATGSTRHHNKMHEPPLASCRWPVT